jgi:hypothetical protein
MSIHIFLFIVIYIFLTHTIIINNYIMKNTDQNYFRHELNKNQTHNYIL